MKKQRDEFQATVKKQAEVGEAALERSKTELESKWNGFEAQVQTYIGTTGKQIEQQKATFQDVAAAQAKAWREAAGKFHDSATKFGAERRGDIDAAIKQMKADASEAEARLLKLKEAGEEFLDGVECRIGRIPEGIRPRKSGGMGSNQAHHFSEGIIERARPPWRVNERPVAANV